MQCRKDYDGKRAAVHKKKQWTSCMKTNNWLAQQELNFYFLSAAEKLPCGWWPLIKGAQYSQA